MEPEQSLWAATALAVLVEMDKSRSMRSEERIIIMVNGRARCDFFIRKNCSNDGDSKFVFIC